MQIFKKLSYKKAKTIRPKKIRFFLRFIAGIVLMILVILVIYILSVMAIQETVKTADYFIKEEQKRDLIRFESKLVKVREHLDELEERLKTVKVGRWTKISESQKRELLKTVWELKKDSLRVENALNNHQNDFSVTFYPRRDESIEDKFKEYWLINILIDRVIGDVERIIYSTGGVDKFQLQNLREHLAEIRKILK